jgi:hypothetical protein
MSIGVRARTASVSWPIHSPASGPTAKAPTMTLTFVPAARSRRAGRSRVDRLPPAIMCAQVTTWSPLVVSTDATCGSVNTAAGAAH